MRKSELVRNQRDENVIAKKAVADYEKLTILHLNVLEQYALKCGANDKWCNVGDNALNQQFDGLRHTGADLDAKFTEAGWLRNEAVGEYATTQTKSAAELRWGEAMRS